MTRCCVVGYHYCFLNSRGLASTYRRRSPFLSDFTPSPMSVPVPQLFERTRLINGFRCPLSWRTKTTALRFRVTALASPRTGSYSSKASHPNGLSRYVKSTSFSPGLRPSLLNKLTTAVEMQSTVTVYHTTPVPLLIVSEYGFAGRRPSFCELHYAVQCPLHVWRLQRVKLSAQNKLASARV